MVETSMVSSAGLNYAGAGRRLVAGLIDGIVLGLLYIPFNLIIAVIAPPDGSGQSMYASVVATLLTLLMMAIQIGYYVYFTGAKGQTLGKMALGVKVVDKATLSVPGYGKAFMREIVGKFISSIVLMLGYLWIIWDKEKQGWHDKIANTVVIRT